MISKRKTWFKIWSLSAFLFSSLVQAGNNWKRIPDQYTCMSTKGKKSESVEIMIDTPSEVIHLFGKLSNGKLSSIAGIVAHHHVFEYFDAQMYNYAQGDSEGYTDYHDFLSDAGIITYQARRQEETKQASSEPVRYVETRPGALIKSRDDTNAPDTRPGAQIKSRDDRNTPDTRPGAQIKTTSATEPKDGKMEVVVIHRTPEQEVRHLQRKYEKIQRRNIKASMPEGAKIPVRGELDDAVTSDRFGHLIGSKEVSTFSSDLSADGQMKNLVYRADIQPAVSYTSIDGKALNDSLYKKISHELERIQKYAACCQNDSKAQCNIQPLPEDNKMSIKKPEPKMKAGSPSQENASEGGAIFSPFSGSR